MTIDQRLEFLLQSTRSLHASVQEQSAQIAKHSAQLAIDAERICTLARIAEAHE